MSSSVVRDWQQRWQSCWCERIMWDVRWIICYSSSPWTCHDKSISFSWQHKSSNCIALFGRKTHLINQKGDVNKIKEIMTGRYVFCKLFCTHVLFWILFMIWSCLKIKQDVSQIQGNAQGYLEFYIWYNLRIRIGLVYRQVGFHICIGILYQVVQTTRT